MPHHWVNIQFSHPVEHSVAVQHTTTTQVSLCKYKKWRGQLQHLNKWQKPWPVTVTWICQVKVAVWFVGCWRVRTCQVKEVSNNIWIIIMKIMIMRMTVHRVINYFNDTLCAYSPTKSDSFNFYYTSQFIGKSMISFVPQNSEVGGTGIIISVLNLIEEKLENTKWLTQVVTVYEEAESQHWYPTLASGWDSQLYFSSRTFLSFTFFISLSPDVFFLTILSL